MGEIKSLKINFIKIKEEIRVPSLIATYINGIPLLVVINKGTVHDIKFIDVHLKDFNNIDKPTILLADKGYKPLNKTTHINPYIANKS